MKTRSGDDRIDSPSKRVLSEEAKRDYYKAWERSGLSKSQFCKEQGLSIDHFYYWHKRFKKCAQTNTSQFSPVVVKDNVDSATQQNTVPVEIRLGKNQAQLFIRVNENRLISFIQEFCCATTVIR